MYTLRLNPTATLLEHVLLAQGFMGVSKVACPRGLQLQNRNSTGANLSNAIKCRCRVINTPVRNYPARCPTSLDFIIVVLSERGLLSDGCALRLRYGTGLGIGHGLHGTLARRPGVRELGTKEDDQRRIIIGSCWIPGSWMCRWRTTQLLSPFPP